MAIRTLRRGAAIAGLAAALSLAAVTNSSAAHWGHWGPGAAIGAGIAGFALGAAAASTAAPYYGYDSGYYGGYYDYDPSAVVVAPGPYYDVDPYYAAPAWSGPWRRPGNCRHDIRGC